MNVEPVDLGDELRQDLQPRLDLAPVILCLPIARESLHCRELHALRCIRDRFPIRPHRRLDAPAQFGKFRFRNVYVKRADGCRIAAPRLCNCIHGCAPLWKNKTGKTWWARNNGRRCSTAKATAIEARHLLHNKLLSDYWLDPDVRAQMPVDPNDWHAGKSSRSSETSRRLCKKLQKLPLCYKERQPERAFRAGMATVEQVPSRGLADRRLASQPGPRRNLARGRDKKARSPRNATPNVLSRARRRDRGGHPAARWSVGKSRCYPALRLRGCRCAAASARGLSRQA